MLIVIGLSALILILLLAVVVLARRGSEDGTAEYETNMGQVDKSVVDLPRAGPPSAPPPRVDPVTAAALAEFHSGTKQRSKVTLTKVGHQQPTRLG